MIEIVYCVFFNYKLLTGKEMPYIKQHLIKTILLCTFFLGYFMKANANDIINMKLKDGIVKIQMRPDLAPNHVKRIKELIKSGFYDGLLFHRVIDGFMAQTGDPNGNGTGGSGKNLKAEFSKEKHIRGTVSMARAQNVDSADSQFFICFEDAPWLDEQYTIWGQVIKGMKFVDMIKKGEGSNGEIRGDPDKIITMKIVKTKTKN